MNKLIQLFRKAGGWNVLRQYARAHVLLTALTQMLLNGFSKKSLEIVRLAVTNKILRRLRKKYRSFIERFQAEQPSLPRSRSNKVWVCWLQGMEQAPSLVQQCFASLQKNLPDRDIILLTEKNYRDYVTFPAHIQNKIDSGMITRTHMSDLLRLELLLNYGGTWIDATVFCSGKKIPDYLLDSELFFFQNLKPGLDGHATCLSSWLMTACAHHPILELTRALLWEYWRTNKQLMHYFLLHFLFQLAIEAYPEEWSKVVPFSNSTPHILLLRLFEPYDQTIWDAVKEMTPFHKLTYKFDPQQTQLADTYYTVIFGSKEN